MPDGLLVVRGTISVDLFWPCGESDGNTVKVALASDNAFSYSTTGDPAALRPTHAFDGAVVKGETRKSAIDKRNRVTIRLQGVATTELHCAPATLAKDTPQTVCDAYRKVDKQYRQPFGESAPLALRAALAGRGANVLPCRVETRVDHPNEVFDTYGRLIGAVIVEGGAEEIDLNAFLLREGWGFPAFYVSMTHDEIRGALSLAQAARKAGKGIWKHYTQKPGRFDFEMQYRSGKKVNNPQMGEDAGPTLFPKFFRRQTTWACQHAAGATKQDLHGFLKAHHDPFVTTGTFLSGPPKASTLDAVYSHGAFQIEPEDMVFEEKNSTLIDADGNPVEDWFTATAATA